MNRYAVLLLLKTAYSLTAVDPELCSNDFLYCYNEETGSITKVGTEEGRGEAPFPGGFPGGASPAGVKTSPYKCTVKGVISQVKDVNLPAGADIPLEQRQNVISPVSASLPTTSLISTPSPVNPMSFSAPLRAPTSGAPAGPALLSSGSPASSLLVTNLPTTQNTQIVTSLPNTPVAGPAPLSMQVPVNALGSSSGPISYVEGPPRIVPGEETPQVSVSKDKICFTRPIQKYVHVQCCKNSMIPIKQGEREKTPCLCPWHSGSTTGQSPYTVSGSMKVDSKLERLLLEDIHQLEKVRQLL